MECITGKCSIWYSCFTPGSSSPQARCISLRPGLSPLARFVPSNQVTGNSIVVKLAERGLAMSPQDKQARQGTDPICAVQLGWGQSRWLAEEKPVAFQCHVAGNRMFLLTRQLAVEERLAGGWGGGWRSRASSLSGAGTIAIVLFQDCELKMLELLGAQQKASKDFSSFLKLKTGGS